MHACALHVLAEKITSKGHPPFCGHPAQSDRGLPLALGRCCMAGALFFASPIASSASSSSSRTSPHTSGGSSSESSPSSTHSQEDDSSSSGSSADTHTNADCSEPDSFSSSPSASGGGVVRSSKVMTAGVAEDDIAGLAQLVGAPVNEWEEEHEGLRGQRVKDEARRWWIELELGFLQSWDGKVEKSPTSNKAARPGSGGSATRGDGGDDDGWKSYSGRLSRREFLFLRSLISLAQLPWEQIDKLCGPKQFKVGAGGASSTPGLKETRFQKFNLKKIKSLST